MGPRDSMGFEFVRVLKGNIQWHFEGQVHHLGPGGFILSHPNQVEKYVWDTEGLTQHDHVHFTMDECPSSAPPPELWPRAIAHLPSDNILHALFQQIIHLIQGQHPQKMAHIQDCVEHMLSIWVHGLYDHGVNDFKGFSLPVQKVLDAVYCSWQQHDLSPPSIEQMLQWASVSKSTLIRLFHRELGSSPSKLMEEYRIHMGRLMLCQSNRSIQQISDALGYPNPFLFSRNFKQVFGSSPRAYRENPSEDEFDYRFVQVFHTLAATQTL